MANPDALRYTRIPLAHGSGAIPAVGFWHADPRSSCDQTSHEDRIGSGISTSRSRGTASRSEERKTQLKQSAKSARSPSPEAEKRRAPASLKLIPATRGQGGAS